MKLWEKLSAKARYYIISFTNLAICWGILYLLNLDFLNIIFFLTAFTWHFALLTPGLKEQILTSNNRFSFLAVVVRSNHYLQMFINLKRVPYASSFIRAISPVIFTLLLFMVGGKGNLLFTLLGSLCFEVVYLFSKKKRDELPPIPSEHTDAQETAPESQHVKKSLE
ncbi:hypothetical protein DOM21_01685 [Bacteriovorax stolpii]|uniref:Uncharacterized protein n=1 Tax=Bacteriovorax stolpii TaxID=960 RepID=A0A2K9NWC9_BACTC|nr:hypothetical protein [Bacteriovorax stolpii]AUN99817.1 hypothetical protein C0V70_17245 [Bacteriovorax stolpii]QDK40190.1 hypothetical protein DOM21_01685 [Bacteriovorax stolpii]TDP54292.1 hypothetical protein C8D79_1586 [Bacteriovorax stolpii]